MKQYLLIFLLAFVLTGVVLVNGLAYLKNKRIADRAQASAEGDAALNNWANKALAQLTERAIRKGEVIKGMDADDVLMAKGRPDEIRDGEGLQDSMRAKGVIQLWIYEEGSGTEYVAAFNTHGRVIASTTQPNY